MQLNKTKLHDFGLGFLIGLLTAGLSGVLIYIGFFTDAASHNYIWGLLKLIQPALLLLYLSILIAFTIKRRWWVVLGLIIPVIPSLCMGFYLIVGVLLSSQY